MQVTGSSLVRDLQTCRGTASEVSALIRRTREAVSLTQHELAERMGSTQSAVTRWEGGEHEVTMRTLSRIAGALEVEFVVRFGQDGADA